METLRLTVRRFQPDDWQDLYAYLSQEEVVKYEPYDVYSADASKSEAIRRSQDPSFLAVCLKDTGKLIGNVFLWERDFNKWEFGYAFNADYHGKGYATEAAHALLDDVFHNQNARRVVAFCNPLNVSSWRLLERLRFRREGCFLKDVCFKKDMDGNPIWSDSYAYAILREEWLDNNVAFSALTP